MGLVVDEMSFGRAITRLADAEPDGAAVVDSSGTLTWAELDRRSNALARALQARGVGKDDLVSVGVPSDARFVALCAAIWKAGATPQPLPPELPADELTQVKSAGRPALVIGFDETPLAALEGEATDDSPVPDVWASSWKAPTSSGSTGVPKVIWSAAPARLDPSAPTAPYIPDRAVQLCPAPLHHAAAFLFAMRGLLIGHTLVPMTGFEPAEALRLITAHSVTWAVLSPPAMQQIWRLGDVVRDDADVSGLAILHVGTVCPPWLKRAWIDWLGPDRVDEIYSGTESIGVTHIGGADWLEHPGSVGRPVQGTSVRILDEHGRSVPAGTVGRVHLRPRGGPGSTYRYGGDVTADAVDGHESLGDLGRLDDDGYLYLVDREADVIETGDGPIYPATVEAVLDAHPAVRGSVVAGRDGSVHAAVQATEVTEDELLDWCREKLPAGQVPASIRVGDTPVRDGFGKARRSDL